MRVLFIFTPVHPKSDGFGMRWVPPLAVYYLATILKKNNIDVDIVDPQVIRTSDYFTSETKADEFASSLLAKDYDAILFSSTTGNWGVAKSLIHRMKKLRPETPIILGGVHASYFDEYILKTAPVDFIIRGEGEKALPEILNSLKSPDSYRNINGISFRDLAGNIVQNPVGSLLTCSELMENSQIDYSLVPDNVYASFGIETSRGCKFNCIFCSVCHRSSWRGLPVDFVVDRIVAQCGEVAKKTTSGSASFFLVDDCFTANPERAYEILAKLNEKNLNYRFAFEARVNDLLTPDFVEKIPSDLIEVIQVGVEAGYNEGLKKIRKGITVEQLEECVQLLSDYGLQTKVSLSFIIGFPWETMSEIRKTLHTIAYLCDTYKIAANLNWLWLMPSDLWFHRKEYNINVDESAFDNPLWLADKDYFFKSHPNITLEDIKTVNNIVSNYREKGIFFGFSGVNFDLD